MPRKPIPNSKQPIPAPTKRRYSFTAMDPEKRREACRKGGRSVPDSKRSFSIDRELASRAGRLGGLSVHPETRTFSRDHALAAEAGRKGGYASHGGGRKPKEV